MSEMKISLSAPLNKGIRFGSASKLCQFKCESCIYSNVMADLDKISNKKMTLIHKVKVRLILNAFD